MAMDNVRLSPGMRVITADDEALGNVEEILGDYFKVQRSDEAALWLRLDTVSETDDQAAHVSFRENAVIEHSVPAPPDRYRESHYLSSHLTEEEEEQRRLMLRELAEQRGEHGDGSAAAGESVGISVEEELARMERGGPHESHAQHEHDEPDAPAR
ncbi:MAG: DUF2171 domain-containing protein [Dehalococcoidia bacterium]